MKVTVYAYEVYSEEQGTYLPTEFEVFATLETINGNPNLRIVASNSIEVDESELTETGRAYRS